MTILGCNLSVSVTFHTYAHTHNLVTEGNGVAVPVKCQLIHVDTKSILWMVWLLVKSFTLEPLII
jgi:hypothetical protein